MRIKFFIANKIHDVNFSKNSLDMPPNINSDDGSSGSDVGM